MKVAVVTGRNEGGSETVKHLLRKVGLKVSRKPDVVLSYGGDGTLLLAERTFPDVPKLVIKDSRVCHKCDYEISTLEQLLQRLKKKDFKKIYVMKLQCGDKVALNEFQLHNANPTTAIRFSTDVRGETHTNIIADGAIICTPFGSSGYYLSAGGKRFEKGIGFTLNNPHNAERKARVLDEDSTVTMTLQRGPALLCYDNAECVEVREGESFTVTKSKERACFLTFP